MKNKETTFNERVLIDFKIKNEYDVSRDCFWSDKEVLEMMDAVNKNCNLQNVSVSLLHQKAIEYAKIIHQEEFDDPCFAPDVEQTIRDFKSGFEAAIRFSNER